MRSLQVEVEFEVNYDVSSLWTKEGKLSFKGWTLPIALADSRLYSM